MLIIKGDCLYIGNIDYKIYEIFIADIALIFACQIANFLNSEHLSDANISNVHHNIANINNIGPVTKI